MCLPHWNCTLLYVGGMHGQTWRRGAILRCRAGRPQDRGRAAAHRRPRPAPQERFGLALAPDWVLELDSSTAAKFSRHLVVRAPGAAFASNLQVGAFVRSLLEPARTAPAAAAACAPAHPGPPGSAFAAPAAPASETTGSPAAARARGPCRDPGDPDPAGAPATAPAPPPPAGAAASPVAEPASGSTGGAGEGALAGSPPAAPGAAGGGGAPRSHALPADPAGSPATAASRAAADCGAVPACSGSPPGGACRARAPCAAAEGGGARGPGRADALSDGEAEALRQQLLVTKVRRGVQLARLQGSDATSLSMPSLTASQLDSYALCQCGACMCRGLFCPHDYLYSPCAASTTRALGRTCS